MKTHGDGVLTCAFVMLHAIIYMSWITLFALIAWGAHKLF